MSLIRNLEGPARRVALAGLVIVSLIVASVALTLWRYSGAENQAQTAISEQADSRRAEQINDVLIERGALLEPNRPMGPAQMAKLRGLQTDFEGLLGQLRRASASSDDTAELAQLKPLTEAHATLVAMERTLLPRLGRTASRPELMRYQRQIVTINHLLDPVAKSNIEDATASAARSLDEERTARLVGLIVGGLAVLLTLFIVGYVVRLLARIFGRIQSTVTTLTAAALEMRTAAQESAAATTQQSAGIAEAAATVEELSSTAGSIAASTPLVARHSQ